MGESALIRQFLFSTLFSSFRVICVVAELQKSWREGHTAGVRAPIQRFSRYMD